MDRGLLAPTFPLLRLKLEVYPKVCVKSIPFLEFKVWISSKLSLKTKFSKIPLNQSLLAQERKVLLEIIIKTQILIIIILQTNHHYQAAR